MKLLNFGKLKSWLKKTFTKTSESIKNASSSIKKEEPHNPFKPRFAPTIKFAGNPIWFGTNKDRKKKTNKVHRSRIIKRKHRKSKAA